MSCLPSLQMMELGSNTCSVTPNTSQAVYASQIIQFLSLCLSLISKNVIIQINRNKFTYIYIRKQIYINKNQYILYYTVYYI